MIGTSAIARLALAAALLIAGLSLRFLLVYVAGRTRSLAALVPRWVSLQRKFAGSLDLLIFGVLFHLTEPLFSFSAKETETTRHFASIVMVVASTWFAVQFLDLAAKVFQEYWSGRIKDEVRRRGLQTQIQFAVKLLGLAILVVGAAVVLMSFDDVRRLGTSLLASAGVASVVIGFAAQKSLGNLIAGLQIAFTQPLRIGDVLVVETEWGVVEEISLTYVVLKLWDLRRLILPITYFTEHPFQNWTRSSSEILGYFYIYADYSVPIEDVRQELKRRAAASKLWRGQVCTLQVTDVTDKTIQLRGLVDARNSSDAFDLRCLLREQLVTFINERCNAALPRHRSDIQMGPLVASSPAETRRDGRPAAPLDSLV